MTNTLLTAICNLMKYDGGCCQKIKHKCMENLIKALTILNKYLEGYHKEYPTTCEHDVLFVQVDYTKISQDDLDELRDLGFRPCEDLGNMMSFKYGSC